MLGMTVTTATPYCDLLLEGHTAVSLFMTLSGFLFATICKDKEIDRWSFYKNRFLRIYPLFVVVLLLACYLDPQRNTITSLLTSLCFMQNMPSAVYLDDCTGSLWAIAVEFQFYLLFPFLMMFFRKYGYKYLTGLIGLAFLIRWGVYLTTGHVHELSYMTIFGRIDQFLIGMTLGLLFDKLKTTLRHPFFLILSMAFVGALASLFNKYGLASGEGISRIFIIDFEALVWGLLIASYNASMFRLPRKMAQFFAYGGTLSYSLYLIHPFVMRFGLGLAHFIYHSHIQFPLLARLVVQLSHQSFYAALLFGLGIAFPITFVVSMLTFALIEKPFLELRTVYSRPTQSDLEGLLKPSKQLVRSQS